MQPKLKVFQLTKSFVSTLSCNLLDIAVEKYKHKKMKSFLFEIHTICFPGAFISPKTDKKWNFIEI